MRDSDLPADAASTAARPFAPFRIANRAPRVAFIHYWLVGMRGRDSISAPKLAVRLELDYRKPVMYGPELVLELRIARVGNSSFTIRTTGIQEDEVVFEALNVMVTVDPETKRPRPISEKDKAYLRTYMDDEG